MPEYALLLAFIAVNGLAAHYVLHAGGSHVYELAAGFPRDTRQREIAT